MMKNNDKGDTNEISTVNTLRNIHMLIRFI